MRGATRTLPSAAACPTLISPAPASSTPPTFTSCRPCLCSPSALDWSTAKAIEIAEGSLLAGTLDVKAFLNDDKLAAIFNQFDTDNSGYISRENIVTALAKMGHEITQAELDDVMRKHDLEKNGIITKDEFKALFLDTSDLTVARNFELTNQ